MTIIYAILLLAALVWALHLYWRSIAPEQRWTFGWLLLIKIAAAWLFGLMNEVGFSYVADTWGYHMESLEQYALLQKNGWQLFSDFFPSTSASEYLNIFESTNSFWHNIKTTLIVKIFTLFNCLSFGNYYINCIFYSIISFAGPLALYKVFVHMYPNRHNLLIITCFLLPSFLYWNSGMHKDGLIFAALAVLIHACYFSFHGRCFPWTKIVLIGSSLLLILLFRNFIALTLLPALVAWYISVKKRLHPFRVFFLVYAVFVVLFFTLRYLHPALDFPHALAMRQQEFFALKGQSQLPLNYLYPDFRIYLNTVPQALNHTLMRPYLSENNTVFFWAAGLEVLAYEVIFIIFLLFRRENKNPNPVVYALVFFAMSMMLMIGYTIPFIGAFVRYRAMFWPLLLAPMLCNTDWEKAKSLFSRK